MVLQLHQDLLQRVGETPLIPLSNIETQGLKLMGKLEWYNPFGSLKDRAAYWMIKEAEGTGELLKGSKVIIEPTSGNTGIALAGIAYMMGYKVELVIPARVSEETKALARSLGAKLNQTDDDLCPRVGAGTDQCIALAQAMVKGHPGMYYMPNQYENEANFFAHYESTGPEIWRDTGGMITQFIAGIGTGGTLTGVAKYLKERNPEIKVYGVEPQRRHHIQGLRNMKESSMPALLRRRSHLIDEWIEVSDESALGQVRQLIEKERLLVGPSSGAILSAARQVVKQEDKGVAVLMFADDGRKFWSLFKEFNVLSRDRFSELLKKARYTPQNHPLVEILNTDFIYS